MIDSIDNARGPERIWHAIDRRGKIEACPDAHVQPCDDVASAYVEYIRADLPPPATNPKWIKNCIKCSRIIDTREEEDGGDPHGCEYDAGWVCSSECADLYLSDADVMAHPKVLALETRLAEVEKERDEADDLAKAAFADGASNNIRLAEAAHRIKLLETRTKEAVKTLRKGFKSCDPTKTAAAIILAIAQLEGHGE